MKNLTITYAGNTKMEFYNFKELYKFLHYVYRDIDFTLFFGHDKIDVKNPFDFFDNTVEQLLMEIKKIVNENLRIGENCFCFEIESWDLPLFMDNFNITIHFQIDDLF